MRMWGLDPRILCSRHLVGEHGELHLFIWCLVRHRRLEGYTTRGLMDIRLMVKRHRELADEMHHRGMAHNSKISDSDKVAIKEFIKSHPNTGFVDLQRNLYALRERCAACRMRMDTVYPGKIRGKE